MADILSNFEGLPKLLIKKKKCIYFLIIFCLRTEGVLPTPASQSLYEQNEERNSLSVANYLIYKSVGKYYHSNLPTNIGNIDNCFENKM